MSDQEYAQGAQVLCLLGAIVLYITALLIHHLPVHDHDCPQCRLDEDDKRRKRAEEAHRYWHRGVRYRGCEWCDRDDDVRR